MRESSDRASGPNVRKNPAACLPPKSKATPEAPGAGRPGRRRDEKVVVVMRKLPKELIKYTRTSGTLRASYRDLENKI
jgi:hypothetical protein